MPSMTGSGVLQVRHQNASQFAAAGAIAAEGAIAASTDGANPIYTSNTSDTLGDITAQPDGAAAPRSTLSMLEAMIMANATGIAALRELMRENVTLIKALS